MRLPSPDAYGVFSASDDRVAIRGYHAQIAVLQLEMRLLTCAGIKMNTLKTGSATRGAPGTGGNFRYNCTTSSPASLPVFVTVTSASTAFARIYCCLREREIVIAECGVTQTIAKGTQRLAAEVAVGAVFHGIVLEIGQLADVLIKIKGDGQTACGVIAAIQSIGSAAVR
jgi:hypothetical protein